MYDVALFHWLVQNIETADSAEPRKRSMPMVARPFSETRLEMDFGSVLESDLGQRWRCGALKACIG